MPRAPDGTYTLPASNPVVDGTPVASGWANETMDDIAAQLNDVIGRDMIPAPTAPYKSVNGSVALPGIAFAASPGTGLWNAVGSAGYSYGGVAILNTNGLVTNAGGTWQFNFAVIGGNAAIPAGVCLDLQGTAAVLKLNSLTSAQIAALTGIKGMFAYDNEVNSIVYFDGTNWVYNAAAILAGSDGSSYVGYIQSGTGAVATTVQARLRRRLDVKDFGAKGDGVTNDTVAIQNALNAASQQELYFPNGTYMVNATLIVKTKTILTGENGEASIIKAMTGLALGSPLLRNENQTVAGTDDLINFSKLTFDGNSLLTTTRAAPLLSLIGIDTCGVYECVFYNNYFTAITVDACFNVDINDNYFLGLGRTNGASPAIDVKATSAVGTNNDIRVTNNTFTTNRWSAISFCPIRGIFANNTVNSSGENAVLLPVGAADCIIQNNLINSTAVRSVAGAGIEANGYEHVIASNVITSCAGDGIRLVNTQDVVVANNICMANGVNTGTFPNSAGIALVCTNATTIKNVLVMHNRVGDKQATKNQAYGLTLMGTTGVAVNLQVVNNNFSDERLGTYLITAARVGSNNIYQNNIDYLGVFEPANGYMQLGTPSGAVAITKAMVGTIQAVNGNVSLAPNVLAAGNVFRIYTTAAGLTFTTSGGMSLRLGGSFTNRTSANLAQGTMATITVLDTALMCVIEGAGVT